MSGLCPVVAGSESESTGQLVGAGARGQSEEASRVADTQLILVQ